MSKNQLLGNVLKQLRKENGYTQKEFIALLDVNQSTYSNYENNRSNIPSAFLEKVGEILNIDIYDYIEDFFNGYDSQDDFLIGYKNPIEQLLFFEELSELRHYLDNIEDKRTRRKLANDFSLILEDIVVFARNCKNQKFDPEHLEEIKESIMYTLSDLLNEVNNLK